MDIAINNLQAKVPLNFPAIRTLATGILRTNGLRQGELSLTFVTRQKIQALNRKFLKRTYATDVLAFDLNDSAHSKKAIVSAEVIVSIDAALKRSRDMDMSLCDELGLYIVHGILHLCGYNDHGTKATKRMRQREIDMCRKFRNSLAQIISPRS